MRRVSPVIDTLVELVKVMEQDDAVVGRQFLTDGDPDEFEDSLKAVVDHLDRHGFNMADSIYLESLGYPTLNEDCFCFVTSKGIINTGADNF